MSVVITDEIAEYIKKYGRKKQNSELQNDIKEIFNIELSGSVIGQFKKRNGIVVEPRMVECFACGRIYATNDKNMKHSIFYCSDECKRAGQKKKYNESMRINQKPKKKKNQESELSIMARKAREAGMTYGKYVAVHWQKGEQGF